MPELPIADDNEIVEVKSSNGNGHARRLTLTSMITNQTDAPTCPNCGNVVVRNGACYKCLNCGESLGCS